MNKQEEELFKRYKDFTGKISIVYRHADIQAGRELYWIIAKFVYDKHPIYCLEHMEINDLRTETWETELPTKEVEFFLGIIKNTCFVKHKQDCDHQRETGLCCICDDGNKIICIVCEHHPDWINRYTSESSE